MSGPIYHTLIKVKATQFKNYRWHRTSYVEAKKRSAKQCNIPFLMIKTDSSPCLIYAESRDQLSLKTWARHVTQLERGRFRCVVDAAPAPVPEDRRTKLAGVRVVEVDSMRKFGEELARRSLFDWWSANKAFRDE